MLKFWAFMIINKRACVSIHKEIQPTDVLKSYRNRVPKSFKEYVLLAKKLSCFFHSLHLQIPPSPATCCGRLSSWVIEQAIGLTGSRTETEHRAVTQEMVILLGFATYQLCFLMNSLNFSFHLFNNNIAASLPLTESLWGHQNCLWRQF